MNELSCIDCGHDTHLGLGTNDECSCFGEKLNPTCDKCETPLMDDGKCGWCTK